MQERYGRSATPTQNGYQSGAVEAQADDLSESSSDADEDDDGVLALGVLDEQLQDTLEAIRKKDPRVYDASVKFYDDPDEEAIENIATKAKQEKPMYLSDYHRKTLLEGVPDLENDKETLPTYQQQQADLRTSIVEEIHAIPDSPSGKEDNVGSTEDDFLVKKAGDVQDQANGTDISPRRIILDVESADKDPETYLSNFMSAKAWVPNDDLKFQPFESDDDEEIRRTEAFEEAYNLRFEDPKASNEKLMSHARDTVAKYSVRKEDVNPRKKKRDIERAHKDAERRLRLEDKARLRKLKVVELEEKVKMVREAAGMKGEDIPEEDWSLLLNDAWDEDEWERAMKKRFGDHYYNKGDLDSEDFGKDLEKKKIKKPRWDDDIQIDDLVPDFDADEDGENPTFELTDEELKVEQKKAKDVRKSRLSAERDKNKAIRLERRKVEQVVDEHLDINESLANSGKKHGGIFRYRETSPVAHGLTADDILMADDSQLNQFAGLKKLAAFRDPDKKRKDKKHLGKKQRLKQWRQETFGNEQGPTKTLADVIASQVPIITLPSTKGAEGSGMREGERKRKSRKGSRKAKTAKADA